MSLASLLAKDTATLQRRVETAGTSGGIVPSWVDVTASVPGRLEDAKAETKKLYAADNIVVTHTWFTENGNGRIGDRWLSSDGRYIKIAGVRKRRGIGSMSTFYTYDCTEVRPGA